MHRSAAEPSIFHIFCLYSPAWIHFYNFPIYCVIKWIACRMRFLINEMHFENHCRSMHARLGRRFDLIRNAIDAWKQLYRSILLSIRSLIRPFIVTVLQLRCTRIVVRSGTWLLHLNLWLSPITIIEMHQCAQFSLHFNRSIARILVWILERICVHPFISNMVKPAVE